MASIGIDLGTTNSLVAVWKDGKAQILKNKLGCELTPSVISMEAGKILVGQPSKERLVTHPEQTVAGFKRYMGMKKEFRLGEAVFSPEELSSLVIAKLVEDAEACLGEKVEEAIISVPAYFNNDQRFATKTAARLAGITCNRIVNEPSAAALACRMQDMREEQTFLVVDFGGGTLDVSVVDCFENIVEIQAIAGDNHLGGRDFDEVIAKKFCEENGIEFERLDGMEKGKLLRRAEVCKMELSAAKTAQMHFRYEEEEYSLVIKEDMLIEIAGSLLLRLKKVIGKAIKDSGRTPRDITDVLPIGGTCQMPIIRDYLAHLFHKPVDEMVDGDKAVALGLGTYCGIKMQNRDVKDVLLTDVCPFSLGTEISNPVMPSRPIMSVIIERNTVLPVSVSRVYNTTSDIPMFDIFQGEGYYAEENVKIGFLALDDLPCEIKGKRKEIELIFAYDINGILEVTAKELSTGQESSITIVSAQNPLSPSEIEERRNKMKQIGFAEEEENKEVIALASRIYEESVGNVREQADYLLRNFLYTLRSNSPIRIKKNREQIMPRLRELEAYVNCDVFDVRFEEDMEFEDFEEEEEWDEE